MPTRSSACLPILVLLLMLATAPVHASILVYIEGVAQGHIRGESLQQGEEDNIMALSFSSSMYTGYDPSTGRINSRTQYAPVVLSKEYDRASVPLTQAHHTGELLSIVRIRLYSAGGQQQIHYYTIELTDAFLVQSDQYGNGQEAPVESWGFVFRSITWTDELRGTSTTDRWDDVAAAVLPPGSSAELTLLPPLPNPSAAETMIRFDLPLASRATLDVYDLRGRRVASLFDQATERPRTVVRWSGRDFGGERVANGLYLVKLKWAQGEVTQRVTLMR